MVRGGILVEWMTTALADAESPFESELHQAGAATFKDRSHSVADNMLLAWPLLDYYSKDIATKRLNSTFPSCNHRWPKRHHTMTWSHCMSAGRTTSTVAPSTHSSKSFPTINLSGF